MKFTTRAELLKNSLRSLMSYSPTSFLLKVENGSLTIYLTDYYLTVKAIVATNIEEEGAVSVEAKVLNDLVQLMDNNADVSFISDNDSDNPKIVIKSNGLIEVDTTLIGQKIDNFFSLYDIDEQQEFTSLLNQDIPVVANLNSENQIYFKPNELKYITEKTAYTITTEEYRTNMRNVLLEFNSNYYNAVSTDGYRLVKYTKYLDEETDITYPNNLSINLSKRLVDILNKTNSEAFFTIVQTDVLEKPNEQDDIPDDTKLRLLRIDYDNITTVTKLSSVKFPDYQRIIPTKFELISNVVLNSNQSDDSPIGTLNYAVKNCKAMIKNSPGTQPWIRLNFSNVDNQPKLSVEVQGKNAYSNEYLSEYMSIPVNVADYNPISEICHDNYKITFNIDYLKGLLDRIDNNLASDNIVQFKFLNPIRATVIQPAQSNNKEQLLMIIMPINEGRTF